METTKNSSEKLDKFIACQFRLAEGGGLKGGAVKPFVTVSRQAGAGGITIGDTLAEMLTAQDKKASCPWTVFDRDLIGTVLEKHDLPKQTASYMKEDKVSEIADTMDELFGIHPAAWTLVHKTSETILHLAKMGYAIIVGRGGSIITRNLKGGFHVRLVGSLPKRIRHIEEYYKLDSKKAKEFIEREDKGRERYLKQNFGKDINDPLLYDVVLNTDQIPYPDAAAFIAQAVLKKSL